MLGIHKVARKSLQLDMTEWPQNSAQSMANITSHLSSMLQPLHVFKDYPDSLQTTKLFGSATDLDY